MLFIEESYRNAIEACNPLRLTRNALAPFLGNRAFDAVAIGKAAGALADAAFPDVARIFAAVPEGYPRPTSSAIDVAVGSHPHISDSSFDAGDRLHDFVKGSTHPLLFLISGGASSSVESPLSPWFDRADLVAMNDLLVASGEPIGEINIVRKHLSAIKGGRLGALAPAGSMAFVLSDVVPGQPEIVGSGVASADSSTNADAASILESLSSGHALQLAARLRSNVPETPKSVDVPLHLIADNSTLVAATAAALEPRFRVIRSDQPLDCDVATAASLLAQRLRELRAGECFVQGGEPTVRVTGNGRGGRCCELAVRVALELSGFGDDFVALFGSSDGVDGSSSLAAAILTRDTIRPAAAEAHRLQQLLDSSASAEAVPLVGKVVMMRPTGNNLRDIFVLARS